MTDLNTVIAQFKGSEGYEIGFSQCKHPDLPMYVKRQIDFEHDARLHMALFEEMSNPRLYKYNDMWCCNPDKDARAKDYIVEESAEIGIAISFAFCRLKGIEVVG